MLKIRDKIILEFLDIEIFISRAFESSYFLCVPDLKTIKIHKTKLKAIGKRSKIFLRF